MTAPYSLATSGPAKGVVAVAGEALVDSCRRRWRSTSRPARRQPGERRRGARPARRARPDARPHRRRHARPSPPRPPRRQRRRPLPRVAATEQTSMAMVALGADGVPSYDFRITGTADWQWTSDELKGALGRPGRRPALRVAGAHDAARRRRAARADGPGRRHRHDQLRPQLPPVAHGRSGRRPRGRARAAGRRRRREGQLRGPRLAVPRPQPEASSRTGSAAARPSSRSPSAATACSRARDGLRVRRPGVLVTVIDTVGAGDTFSGALLAGLHDRDLLGAAARPALRAIDEPRCTRCSTRRPWPPRSPAPAEGPTRPRAETC